MLRTTDAAVNDDEWERIRAIHAARARLGCSWGWVVATEDDRDECEDQAVQMTTVHDGDWSATIRLCARHQARLDQETVKR